MSLDLSPFARLFSNEGDALAAIDSSEVVVHWSPKIAELSQIAPGDALGTELSKLFPQFAGSEASRIIAGALQGSSIVGSPPCFAVADPDQALQYEWFAAPVFADGTVQGVVLVTRSVAKPPTTHASGGGRPPPAPPSSEGARDLERLLYATSHDLREPTRMVSNYVELLLGQLGDGLDPTLLKYMRFVEEGAERVRATVDDLLHFAKVRSAEIRTERVDLELVFTSLADELSPIIAETGARLSWQALPTVTGDSALLRSLFGSLLRNSLRFHGGAPPRIYAVGKLHDDHHLVGVIDEGIGFKQHQSERAFEMFQRLHPSHEYRGAGIGLALAREIANRHGGRIWAESEPDQGATFYVELPRGPRAV